MDQRAAIKWVRHLRENYNDGFCLSEQDAARELLELFAGERRRDWTVAPNGRSNSSEKFEFLVVEIARLIAGSAHALLAGQAETVARLILAQLAHVHGMAPTVDSAEVV